MANNYFQFKQFTVQQQYCAMKVSTDACIFGAVVANAFADKALSEKDEKQHYLDIGSGTGLLSLMLAQKTAACIEAVEIDPAAYNQARENFSTSPFSKQLSVFNTDILHFQASKKYDGIVCNPPFFEGDLLSPDKKKNAAKHNTTLSLQQLLSLAASLLKVNGLLGVLLPYHRMDEFEKDAAAVSLYVHKKILLRHTLQHPWFRVILLLSTTITIVAEEELVIKNETGNYSAAFTVLLKDYYLHL